MPGGQARWEGEGDIEIQYRLILFLAYCSEKARETSPLEIACMCSSMMSFDISGGFPEFSKPKGVK